MKMKAAFSSPHLPGDSVFLACSSHEDRCLGIVQKWGQWRPHEAVVFHYDDPNPRREQNHRVLQETLSTACDVIEIPFTEADAVSSFHAQREKLRKVTGDSANRPLVVD